MIGLGDVDSVIVSSVEGIPLSKSLIIAGPEAQATVRGITFDGVLFAESTNTLGLFAVSEQGL
jgi:hypothetical protein